VTDFRRPLHDESTPLLLGRAMLADQTRSCFADEIAIDFPAIQPVVERMRDGLLGCDDGTDAHTTAVSVSPRDAYVGVMVPLEVPLRGTCAACGGRGETWAEVCVSCAGSGQRLAPHQFRLSVPAGVADGTRFRFLVAPPHGMPTRVEVTVLVA
jgi:hypothetical protein